MDTAYVSPLAELVWAHIHTDNVLQLLLLLLVLLLRRRLQRLVFATAARYPWRHCLYFCSATRPRHHPPDAHTGGLQK